MVSTVLPTPALAPQFPAMVDIPSDPIVALVAVIIPEALTCLGLMSTPSCKLPAAIPVNCDPSPWKVLAVIIPDVR